MATSKKARYSAVRGSYGYAAGTIAEGKTAELTEEEAARGLASGAIVPTPVRPKAAPKSPPDPEETP